MNSKQLELLASFRTAKVEFAVVGGVAVIAHGHVRTTRDLDIFIRPTVENAVAAFAALAELGVPLNGMEPKDLLNDEEHLRFGTEDEFVDILSSIGEMSFEQVWRNRVEGEVNGVRIPFISKEDLLENKRQTGRHRDLSDVEELELIPDRKEFG